MSYCTNREWKPAPYTFDKTPQYLNCFKELKDGVCPVHGKDIADPKDKK